MASYTVYCEGISGYQIIGPDVTGREVLEWYSLSSKLSGDARTKTRGAALSDACFALGEIVYAVGRQQGLTVSRGHDSGKHVVEDDGRIAAAIAAVRAAYEAAKTIQAGAFSCQYCTNKVSRQGAICARCDSN